MMARTRLDRCHNCGHRILWVRRDGGAYMPVNAVTVSTSTDEAAGAWVVVGQRTAYRPRDLAEVLMTSRSIALEDAYEAVRADFPWHRRHACPYAQEETTDGTS